MPLVCADLLPPRQVGTRGFSGFCCPEEQGFCWRRFAPAVPAAEQRRCVPFPRGGSGTLRAGQGCARGGTQCPRGFPEPGEVDRVCARGGIPRTCNMLLPNKELLEQIRASRCDLGIPGIWLSPVTVSTDSPSPELGVPVTEQSLGSCTCWGSSGTKRFFTDFVRVSNSPLLSGKCNSPLAALASRISQGLWGLSLASRCGRDKRQSL